MNPQKSGDSLMVGIFDRNQQRQLSQPAMSAVAQQQPVIPQSEPPGINGFDDSDIPFL
jgi:hypothetical protein